MYKGDILLVQVYVDDIIFGSTKKELCNAFENLMQEKLKMSSIGELTFFLRLQVKQKKDGTFISQDKYVAKILKKFKFTEIKTASTPSETQNPLLKDEDGKEVDVHMYRSMIGSLMYLISSRHNIMFVVCACARYKVNPKPSGPTKFVGDKVIHKELGDSLVIAATTASSLEEKRHSGNITKTQSKATPNESIFQRTNSGGCPRCQETMDDTATQTRRVKKLEKRNRSTTHGMKRLYKVGLSAQVESSGDEESLGEDVPKQERRIDAIDADEDITLVNDADKEMFDVDDLGGEEMFVARKNENVDKGKGIMIEEHVKPKKKDQIRLDEEAAKKLQAEFDEEERLAKEKAKKEQEPILP
nr:hypothetical protein [Tanacetum cinerariifolium]